MSDEMENTITNRVNYSDLGNDSENFGHYGIRLMNKM
jgi:hypothetical protein